MRFLKKTAFLLLLIMVAVLGTATVLERLYGTHTVHHNIYDTVPFVLLWMGIAVTALIYITKRRLYKQLPAFLIHISLIVILMGAGVTWLTSTRGRIKLLPDERMAYYTDVEGINHNLPFNLQLRRFDIHYYPHSSMPMDFVSKIIAIDGDITIQATISMNHIFSYQGYRFYQSGYDLNTNATILSVSHDPWGIAITYTGYFLLLISIIGYLLVRRTHFRTLLSSFTYKSSLGRMTGIAVLLFAGSFSIYAKQLHTIPRDVADKMSHLYILHNDRICPFQTFAREFTLKLYGRPTYKGFMAEQVVAGWLFYYDDWAEEPIFKIKNRELRHLLDAKNKRYITLKQFFDENHQYKLEKTISKLAAGEEIPNKRAIQEVSEKLQIVTMLTSGKVLKILPLQHSGNLRWFAPGSTEQPEGLSTDKWTFMRQSFNYLHELVAKEEWEDAKVFLTKLREYQVKECAGEPVGHVRFRAERIYNYLNNQLTTLSIGLVCLGFLCLVFTTIRLAKQKLIPKWLLLMGNIILIFFAIYLSVAIAARWMVSGHIPMSNGFETMQFMAWSASLLTLLFAKRFSLFISFGMLVTGLSLVVSILGESNPAITPLMPVLHSPLLSIHVAVIMLAYCLFAFMMLNGIAALILRRNKTQITMLHTLSLIQLYPAIFLLTIGIFIGAVWANVSWGTYWSWDPKEVWALITLIIYVLPLHNQSLPCFNKPLFFHIYLIVSFLSVLITYFGVNFILGGMHSYA